MTSLVLKTKSGILWSFSSMFSTHLINFISGIILARILEPSDFGIVAIVFVILFIAIQACDFGLTTALVQRRRVHKAHFNTVYLFTLSAALTLSILLWLSADNIRVFYKIDILSEVIPIASVCLVIRTMGLVPQAILRRNLDYRKLGVVKFVGAVSGLLVGYITAINGFGLWSLIALQVSVAAVTTAGFHLTSRWIPKSVLSLRALKSLLSFGIPIYISKIIDAITTRLDIFAFAKLIDIGTLGNYERAKSLNTIGFGYSFQPVVEVIFPFLSKINSNKDRVANIVTTILDVINFTTFLIIGALFFISSDIVVALYGEKWRQTGDFLRYICLASFTYPISSLLMTAVGSKGKSLLILKIEIMKKTLLVLHVCIGVIFGLNIFLYTLVLRAIIATLINIAYVSKEVAISSLSITKRIFLQSLPALLSALLIILIFHIFPAGKYEYLLKLVSYIVLYTALSLAICPSGIKTIMRLLKEYFSRGQRAGSSI